jgi:hypothetical protein
MLSVRFVRGIDLVLDPDTWEGKVDGDTVVQAPDRDLCVMLLSVHVHGEVSKKPVAQWLAEGMQVHELVRAYLDDVGHR